MYLPLPDHHPRGCNSLLPVTRLPKRFPNPGVTALAAVAVVSLLGVLLCVRHRLVGLLRLAAGLRAASLLAAGHGQRAGAEAVQGHGGSVAAGEGVLEVAHVWFRVFSYQSFFFLLGVGFVG